MGLELRSFFWIGHDVPSAAFSFNFFKEIARLLDFLRFRREMGILSDGFLMRVLGDYLYGCACLA